MHIVSIVFAVLIALGLIPFTFLVWHRLDDLIDTVALTLPGSRHHSRLLRKVGDTVGSWLGYTALLCLALGQWVPALVLNALWAVLAGSSAIARRRATAPWWYRVLSV